MAAKLLAAGSLVPTPVWHEDTLEVNYLWLPAMYLPQVRERVSRLAALLSPYSKELFAKSLQLHGKHVEQLTALRALALSIRCFISVPRLPGWPVLARVAKAVGVPKGPGSGFRFEMAPNGERKGRQRPPCQGAQKDRSRQNRVPRNRHGYPSGADNLFG